MMRKRTQQDFINDAREVHGDKYDYSEVKYVNQLTKVKLICNEHGEFLQYPKYHLKGNGCVHCGNKRNSLRRRKSTEDFIESSINAHGDKYDYSKVIYSTSKSKVTIICPEHGEFKQIAQSHMSGHGCSRCSSSHPRNNKSFILDAKKIHQDRYDYSKVEYKNTKTKVILICKEHGEFLQTPNEHLVGSGCIDCAGLRKKTTEQFIEEAILKHGKKYDYSKSNYINSSTIITIVCPIHGEFEQVASQHLSGNGCKDCGYEDAGKKRLKGIDDFIMEANEIHGSRYDYSNSIYKGTHRKIEIICEIHGSFKQPPKEHLIGQGCPECGLIKIGDLKRKSKKDFIVEASKLHQGKYDYTLVEYFSSQRKIKIICPIHGEFEQRPSVHLSNRGCKSCGIISRSDKRRGTTENFVLRAREIHGDKYDYSGVEYLKNNIHVKIKCIEHGEFLQRPYLHLSGRGCFQCGIKSKKTLEEFLQYSKEIHGEKYDYSKVKFVNNITKVVILCEKHGTFLQTPEKHLSGQGCRACSGSLKKTNETFTKSAREIHGDKYDYSKIKYKHAHHPINIICKKHGPFLQTPNSHLKGQQCPKCSYIESGFNKRTSLDEFISKSKKIHKNKFDYTLVNYEGNNVKVKIICPEYGVFIQTPSSHLGGHGCSQCAGLKKKTTEEFILQAKETHGDLYDYSLSKYTGTNKKIIIICKEHGEFKQNALLHLKGSGCSRCFLKNEGRIAKLLNDLVIVHRQYALENKRYDFYLPEYDLIIERDGEQHYRGIVWDGGDKKKAIQFQHENDKYKTELAKTHGLNLCRIPYWLDTKEEKIEIMNILDGNPTYPDIPDLEQEKTKPKPHV